MEGSEWCELTSLCGMHCLKPTTSSFSFGRNSSCSWVCDDRRVSGKHCELFWNREATCIETSVTCVDNSTNGVFINDIKLGKGKSTVLRSGDVIALVAGVKELSFTFKCTILQQKNELPMTRMDTAVIEYEDPTESKETADSALKETSSKIGDEILCGICMGVLYKCVALVPCMHNFCGPCMREWSDTRANAPCPKCRNQVSYARCRNPPRSSRLPGRRRRQPPSPPPSITPPLHPPGPPATGAARRRRRRSC